MAGGLAAAAAGADGRPRFVGDAVADPLTGLHAAAATLGALAAREAQLIDVAMREVAGHALAAGSVA